MATKLPDIIIGEGQEVSPDFPVYVRVMIFNKPGDAEFPHSHPYGHFFACFSGAFELNGERVAVPSLNWIPADARHHVVAVRATWSERLRQAWAMLRGRSIGACLHDRRQADEFIARQEEGQKK